MCLAVPAKVVELREAGQATVDLQGNRLAVSVVLTPEALPGDWVLVHAGFAISRIDEADAFETWEYLRATFGAEAFEEAGGSADVARRPSAASFASVPVALQEGGGGKRGVS